MSLSNTQLKISYVSYSLTLEMNTLHLGTSDVTGTPVAQLIADVIGKNFETWELLLILDRNQILTKHLQGQAFTIGALDERTFYVRIVPIVGNLIRLNLPAGQIRKLRRILDIRRTNNRRI